MKFTALLVLVPAFLLGCAAAPIEEPNLPRDLQKLVFEKDGSSVVLQSVVTNCQAPWRRAVHTTRSGHVTIGCWRVDRDGNLTMDFENGERLIVRKEAFQQASRGGRSI